MALRAGSCTCITCTRCSMSSSTSSAKFQPSTATSTPSLAGSGSAGHVRYDGFSAVGSTRRLNVNGTQRSAVLSCATRSRGRSYSHRS
jgi:hypothetical protein